MKTKHAKRKVKPVFQVHTSREATGLQGKPQMTLEMPPAKLGNPWAAADCLYVAPQQWQCACWKLDWLLAFIYSEIYQLRCNPNRWEKLQGNCCAWEMEDGKRAALSTDSPEANALGCCLRSVLEVCSPKALFSVLEECTRMGGTNRTVRRSSERPP